MLLNRRDGFFDRALEYASIQDFCAIFHQDMNVLFWLALTLTGDERQAERCFIAGFEECIAGNAVFKDWARSWSRRVVIKNAIRLVRPSATDITPAIHVLAKPGSHAQAVQVALSNLPPFDRFVLVMSVLEGYADLDCATLLNCSATDLIKARVRAAQQILRAIDLSPAMQEDHDSEPHQRVALNDAHAA
ncbi:MAG TPA: hypothetical protein VKL40_03080 [Candidatus Angelobacter sp.]|nr:hypothetical protein [Candidatus Angelobacter sp.]